MKKLKNLNYSLILFILLILVSCLFFKYGSDFYWHLKIGNYIFNNKIIPFTDIFSWYGTINNLHWISHEWLFEIIIYLFSLISPTIGPYIFVTIIMILISTLLYKLNYNYFNINSFNIIIWGILGIVAFSSYILPRPHLISYLFFTITLLLIKNTLNNEKYKLIYITPILTILWSNLHGGSSNLGYILYLIIIIASFIPIKNKLTLSSKQLLKLIYAFITSILFIIINPHGLKMLLYPYQNLTYSNMINCIEEWQKLNITTINGIVYTILIIILLVIIIKNIKKITLHHLLLLLAFIVLAFKSIKFIPYLYIISITIITHYLKNYNFKIDKKTIIIFLIIILIPLNITNINKIEFNKVNNNMIKYLKKEKNIILYNSYELGGYLIYKDIKPFVDGRADMYVDNILCDVCQIEKGINIKLINKYKFNTFIIKKNTKLSNYLINNKKYKIIIEDKNNILIKLKDD